MKASRGLQSRWAIPVLIAMCLAAFPDRADSVATGDLSVPAQTGRYLFLSDRSTLVQTGGIAGVDWTYAVQGQFVLTVDPGAGTASFARVDANAVDDSPYRRTLDPNEVFAMTSLVGTVLSDATLEFTGKAADGSDVRITGTLQEDQIHLVAQTDPPPDSADFFVFNMDALAQRKYSGGMGEPNDPYQIATAADLIALGEDPNDYDKHFILTADIDLDPNVPPGKVFDKAVIAPDTGLGHGDSYFVGTPFTGVFDGSGHTILDFRCACNWSRVIGLFGCISGPNSVIKNLKLSRPSIDVDGGYTAGSLVGYLERGTIVDCHIVGGSISGGGTIGGLAGTSEGTVIDCTSSTTVSGIGDGGGLVGTNCGSVIDCYSTGGVTGTGGGGLVARNGLSFTPVGWPSGRGTIYDSYSTASVSGTGTSCGGLVGMNEYGEIVKCYASGVVLGLNAVGGLAGSNLDKISSCYSAARVVGEKDVGGLVGLSFVGWPLSLEPTITNCYSRGIVLGDEHVGGLLGDGDANGVVASFWDLQTSGQTTSAGGTGKTTAEMQMAATFIAEGWDFVGETANGTEDIWWISEGKGYPRLSWQLPAGMVFVDIPAGTFEMGDHDGAGWEDERPVHTVTLDGFQMSRYETTNAQYAQYLNAAMADGLIQVVDGVVYASSDANLVEPYCATYGSHWWDWWTSWSQIEYSQGRFTVRSRDGMTMSDHPVEEVSWYGAKAFCDYYGYRLPTEAEWEYAARGGYHDPYYPYPWGSNTIDCTKANYWGDSGPCNPLNLTDYPYTSPVGYYGPQGAYGLCDMAGNVWEWCQDWYDEDYYSVSPEWHFHNAHVPASRRALAMGRGTVR